MKSILTLAKKLINKFHQSKKFRLFVILMAAKILISVLALIVVGLWAYQPIDAQAAYGLDEKIKQVKTADNSAVYYLDHNLGFKKAYVSGAAFLSYGNKWSDVKTISRSAIDKWPDMRLVKSKNSSQVYYINNGYKAPIESEQQFIDYGFKWSEIAVIGEADLNQYRLTDFDTVRAALENSAFGAFGNQASGVLFLNSLTLNISSLYLPTGSRGDRVAAINLKAGDRDVKITGLTFSQQGVSSDDVVDAVYLTDDNGVIYGEKNTLNNKSVSLNFSSEPIIIPAGQTSQFYLEADLKPVSGVTGQTMRFSILNSADISADATAAAAFPLTGPEFRLVDGANNLGKVRAGILALNTDGASIAIGAVNKAVALLRLAETSGNDDVLIKKIVLTNVGSAADGELSNLSLYDQDGNLVMKAQTTINQKVTFVLEPGYLIKKNHYVDLTLKTSVNGIDGHDLKFIVSDSADIVAVGKNYDYDLTVALDPAPSGNANRFTIKRAPIFLTQPAVKDAEKQIYRDQEDAILGIFELRNNSAGITLSSFNLSIMKSNGAASLDQPLVAIDAKTGNVLGSIDPAKVTGVYADMNLGNLPAAKGKTVKIKFTTHIPDTARSGDSYQIIVKAVNYHVAENNILYSDSVNLSGQKMEVVRPAIYMYPGVPDKNDIAVAGDTGVILGFFRIEATNEQDIRITSLTVTNINGGTALNYANGFTNMALYKSGSRVSDFLAEPNENSYVFDKLKIYVEAGTSAKIYVKADVAENASGVVRLALENAVAESYVGKIPAQVNNKNAVSPAVQITNTVLSVVTSGGGNIRVGQKNNQIGSFIFTNLGAEKIRLNDVILESDGFAGNLSANNGFHNLRFGYLDAKGRIVSVGSRLTNPVADVNDIGLNGFTLNPGETFALNLYIDADENAVAGLISLSIRDILAKGQITGIKAFVNSTPTEPVLVSAN